MALMTKKQAEQIVACVKEYTEAEASVTEHTPPGDGFHLPCVAILTDSPEAVFWAAGKCGFWMDEMPTRKDPLQRDWPNNWTRRGASFYLY